MSEQIWPRLGAACGILYVVLLFGGGATGVDALMPLELAGLVLFIPFLAFVSGLLREAGWLAATVLGAGLVDTAVKLGSAAASLAAEETAEGSAIDLALHDMNDASFILTMYPLALLTGAVALAGLATRALPRWSCWLAAITAVALLVNGSFLDSEFGPAFLLFLVWVLATSVALVLRGAQAPGWTRPDSYASTTA